MLTTGNDTYTRTASGIKYPPGKWVVQDSAEYLHDDQGHFLCEYNTFSGGSQETIWFNGHLVATMINSALYNVSVDNLGTPRVLARASDNLEVWLWSGSDPFGVAPPTNPVASLPVVYNLRFPGQQYDAALNYHYNWMRDYGPQSGRYVQADPLGLGGGLSRYAYGGESHFQGLTRMACKRRAVVGAALAHASTSTNSRIKSSRTVPAQRPTWLPSQAQKRSGPCPRLRELRGLGVPKSQLNPYTSQMSRWSSRLGVRELRVLGRTAAGVALGTVATGALIFDGFYNWGVIGKAAWDARSSGRNCGCGSK